MKSLMETVCGVLAVVAYAIGTGLLFGGIFGALNLLNDNTIHVFGLGGSGYAFRSGFYFGASLGMMGGAIKALEVSSAYATIARVLARGVAGAIIGDRLRFLCHLNTPVAEITLVAIFGALGMFLGLASQAKPTAPAAATASKPPISA